MWMVDIQKFFLNFFRADKLRGRLKRFPVYPYPHICTASLIINIPFWSGTYITIVEPTLLSLRVHSLLVLTLGITHSTVLLFGC